MDLKRTIAPNEKYIPIKMFMVLNRYWEAGKAKMPKKSMLTPDKIKHIIIAQQAIMFLLKVR